VKAAGAPAAALDRARDALGDRPARRGGKATRDVAASAPQPDDEEHR
jgi:hypothetical protein